ncbi:lipoprotein [Streptomyces aureoverticillatus]|nr:lipoprotein [Streptomyces aureoverticillatus]
MPSYLTPSWSRPGPRRRSLLTGAAGAAGTTLLAGCSGSGDSGDGRPSAADKLRARAARDSAGLLRQYDAVLAAHAPLAERLRPLRAEVARHEKAFGDGRATPSPATPRPEGSPTTRRPGGSPAPVSVPDDPKEALRFLATAERELAGRRGKELLDAPAELARLLASVAAAGAAHAYLLTETEDEK